MMSGLPEEQFARHVLKAGARGYVSKSCEPNEFMAAVRCALAGRHYVSSALAESLAAAVASPQPRDAQPHELLSEREFQIFRKLATGASVSSIAIELNLSAKTVSSYRGRLMEKLCLKSNADLTGYAIRHQLV